MPIECLVRKNVPWEAEIDPDQEQKYKESLTQNAPRIYSRMQRKIKNKGDYIDKMATPSSQAMPQIFQPGFITRGERNYSNIINLHSKNAAMSYRKFRRGLDHQFETVDGVQAKRYVEAVSAKSPNWTDKVEKKSLRFTGDKIRGLGVAPFAVHWLSGYKLAAGMLNEGDDLVIGGPFNIVRPGLRNAFKTGLQQALIQSGLMIDAAEYDIAEITAQNDRINTLIQGFVDPALGVVPFTTSGPTNSHCNYQFVKGLFRLEIQVMRI